jgi:hypothetical protein
MNFYDSATAKQTAQLKSKQKAGHQWLTPVILPQEAEIRRMAV